MSNEIITTPEQISALALELKKSPLIAFDTEFIRENTFYPEVELLQIADANTTWLVDIRAFRSRSSKRERSAHPALEPLFQVLEDPSILKIVHAAQGDQECLFTAFRVVAKPSLDTAIAAALTGYGEQIGLSNLLKDALNVSIKKGHARTNWGVRPLPPELMVYAREDVAHLVRLAEHLIKELDRLGRRNWAIELSARYEEAEVLEPPSELLVDRIVKGARMDRTEYRALIDLMKWREQRVRDLNLPRRWVADDSVLIDLARTRPKNIEQLSNFRGLNKGELKHSGEALLRLFREAEAHPEAHVPRGERLDSPSTSEAQVMNLLKCFVGILAEERRIAHRFLIESHQWLKLVRAKPKSTDDLLKLQLLNPHAVEIMGEEIVGFLTGRRALYIDGLSVGLVERQPGEKK